MVQLSHPYMTTGKTIALTIGFNLCLCPKQGKNLWILPCLCLPPCSLFHFEISSSILLLLGTKCSDWSQILLVSLICFGISTSSSVSDLLFLLLKKFFSHFLRECLCDESPEFLHVWKIILFYHSNASLGLFFFFKFYFIINDVVIVSSEQWRASAIHIHVSILPQTLLPSRLPHNTEQISMFSLSTIDLWVHSLLGRLSYA